MREAVPDKAEDLDYLGTAIYRSDYEAHLSFWLTGAVTEVEKYYRNELASQGYVLPETEKTKWLDEENCFLAKKREAELLISISESESNEGEDSGYVSIEYTDNLSESPGSSALKEVKWPVIMKKWRIDEALPYSLYATDETLGVGISVDHGFEETIEICREKLKANHYRETHYEHYVQESFKEEYYTLEAINTYYENSPIKEYIEIWIVRNSDNETSVDFIVSREKTADKYANMIVKLTDHYYCLSAVAGVGKNFQALFDDQFSGFYRAGSADSRNIHFTSQRNFEDSIAHFKRKFQQFGTSEYGQEAEYDEGWFSTVDYDGSVYDSWTQYEIVEEMSIYLMLYRCKEIGPNDTDSKIGEVTGIIEYRPNKTENKKAELLQCGADKNHDLAQLTGKLDSRPSTFAGF